MIAFCGGASAQQDASETNASTAAAPRYMHAEKLPAGTALNSSLPIDGAIDPNCLSQVGNHVCYDGDQDGVPEFIVARAHHDEQGNIIAGAPAAGLAPDYNLSYGPADRADIVERLRTLSGLRNKKLIGDADYLRAQTKVLAGLRPQSLGVEEGLVFLADLWDAGLISEIPYGIKRHEMVDAIVAAHD